MGGGLRDVTGRAVCEAGRDGGPGPAAPGRGRGAGRFLLGQTGNRPGFTPGPSLLVVLRVPPQRPRPFWGG